MALVKVDVTDIMANVARQLPTKNDMVELRRQLGDKARTHWAGQAQKELKGSTQDYIQALSYREQGARVFVILTGTVPNMIENGQKAYDMRDTLLKGPNAKMGKNGMYNTVPFRHGTPGTGGSNVGAPMPKPIYRAAYALDKPTRSQAKKLTERGGQPVLYGKRLSPDGRKAGSQVHKILTTLKKPWHTASIYTGMTKQTKVYEKKSDSQYMTFRRISRYVPPNGKGKSWFHPGIKARRFVLKTQAYVEKIGPELLREVIQGPKGKG